MTAEPRPEHRRTWEADRKRKAREARLAQRREDPHYPGKGVLVSPLGGFEHGTEYGYNEFGCRCVDRGAPVPDPDNPNGPHIPSGCSQAGIAAAARRRANRRRGPAAPSVGPTDSALAQLDSAAMFHPANIQPIYPRRAPRDDRP